VRGEHKIAFHPTLYLGVQLKEVRGLKTDARDLATDIGTVASAKLQHTVRQDIRGMLDVGAHTAVCHRWSPLTLQVDYQKGKCGGDSDKVKTSGEFNQHAKAFR
jgi:hypothetical protein